MNERIKQLAKQVDACYIPRYDMWQMDTETMEKFAELIIRECQLRVEQYINKCGEVASMPDTVIMKHFGVE